MISKINKRLKPFTFSEKCKIISFKLIKKIAKIDTTILVRKYDFVTSLVLRKIKFSYTEGLFSFEYPLNNTNLNFTLLKQSSDLDVFNQIIFEEEYKIILELSKKHNIFLNNIIDAGSNIGLVTLYLKAFFPSAKIIAIEPSKSTFLRLKNNILKNNIADITLKNEGVWGSSTTLCGDFSFGDGRDWAFSLREKNNDEKGTIKVSSIKDLIDKNNFKLIDFLKIDIEGGELELFKSESDVSWLKSVKMIAIEIHDELNIRNEIEKILLGYNFELIDSGELTIGVNLSLL